MLPTVIENETDVEFIVRAITDKEMVAKYPRQQERIVAAQEILQNHKRDSGDPNSKREMRIINDEDIEMRVEDKDGEKRLQGYAAKFNKWSEDLGYFREKIAPGAFTDAIKDSDVRALKNHDPNLLLGRTSAGTLRLVENKVGLKFEVDMPNTTTGQDTLEEVRRGDITGCSFGFTVKEQSWRYLEDGNVERTIVKVGELFDVGPVTYPAYPDTSVAARSREAFVEGIEKEKREAEQKEKEAKAKQMSFEQKNQIDRGYREAGRIILRNRPADD